MKGKKEKNRLFGFLIIVAVMGLFGLAAILTPTQLAQTQTCTPTITVTEGNLVPGGVNEFLVTSGSGTITVDPVNNGTGLQSLAVVSATNATVNIPPFMPGTTDAVVVTFTVTNPNLPVDIQLRAASTFHAANIRAQCGNVCTPTLTITEGNLFPGGVTEFLVTSGAGSVTVDPNNNGTGLQSLTVVGVPVNATVNIPAFTPGTSSPVVVTFTVSNPALPVDFTLRAASTFHAANIRVQCGTP